MPIEFRCTSCQQNLRVPDATSGRNAKCPKCGAILVVPSPLGAPLPSSTSAAPSPRPQFSPGRPAKPPAEGFANPYASPQAASYPPQVATPGGPIVNQAVTVEQVFNYSW